MSTSGFEIYNASAGSGKTFTLVKAYLKAVLSAKNPLYFKHLLALTFTNKAVNEMKSRILNTLSDFGKEDILSSDNQMFKMLLKELNFEPETLQKKAKQLLGFILHNYASFDVSTIDKFNHRLIRTFAHDLKIPTNFEVELDQDSLLNQAVDNLIQKAGEDDLLTKLLIDFSIEKADDDKSWDISFDFSKIAKLLVNENHKDYVSGLSEKTIEDFNTLKNNLRNQITSLEKEISQTSKQVLQLIDEAGLEHSDFLRGSLPKHFVKLQNKEFNIDFNKAQWMQKLENQPLYPKSTEPAIAKIIDAILPELITAFNTTKTLVYELRFLQAIYKNSTPLSVLNAINTELQLIKEEENKLLISEFNGIISKEIKDQPTPYIYERLGEKYKHYFIDEFQDTSKLQWGNLQKLISNALEQEYFGEQGSLLLVGDAKQAIYRWRGGYAEQFINLYNKTDYPFSVIQNVYDLDSNYRSSRAIVEFNNDLFKFLSKEAFTAESYQQLYDKAPQSTASENEGYVNLRFLEIGKEDDKEKLYSVEVCKVVKECLNSNYSKQDIAILVRKKSEGLAISEHLQEQGVAIQSSETMLLKNSEQVKLINNLLQYIIEPENKETKVNVLHNLSDTFYIDEKHRFLKARVHLEQDGFFNSLELQNRLVSIAKLKSKDLYDLTETLVRNFIPKEKIDAYIQSYLDVVFAFSQKKGSDIKGFLEHFEKKQNELAIASAGAQDAIKIMTIHKAKGLEFPVVIFPFADLDIYREKEAKEWIALDEKRYNGFDHTLLNYNKDFEYFNEESREIHVRHQSELELDNINLLYVTLTRAKEQLYIISKFDVLKKVEPNRKTYSGKFISYLQHKNLWDSTNLNYSFGKQSKAISTSGELAEGLSQNQFISNAIEEQNISIVTKSGLLWDTVQQKSIERGNLIHDLMALIKTEKDIPFALDSFLSSGKISKEQVAVLERIVLEITHHQKLVSYFNEVNKIYNEQNIISSNGEFYRPDRIVILPNGKATVIDYKSGKESPRHESQILTYKQLLEQMQITVEKMVLVYINDEIYVKEF